MKKDAVDRFLDPNSPERKRAEAAINAIDIANCTSVTDITLAVERTLNTRIKVIETDVLNGVELCGVWGKRDGYDIIYHAETNSETYKDQIVLHELAHMLLKHNPDP